ncbi:MAG: hypothetical protein LBG59_04800 [Candidatus Peribacteria bacterium]|jgi:hypothetical protein|nr:hypothetical protein [Candidatus Peribacteria bacterium]
MGTDPILQEKLQHLETMISKMMCATLKQEPSTSVYINIQKKPEGEHVSFFLLKTFAKQFGCSEEQLTQYLKKYSTHVLQPFTLDEYQTLLGEYIIKRQQERPERTDIKDIILTDEGIDYFCIMEKILEKQKKNAVFLLFDHIDSLTRNEQQQINNLIATR